MSWRSDMVTFYRSGVLFATLVGLSGIGYRARGHQTRLVDPGSR